MGKEISAAAKLEVLTRFIEQHPDDPLAVRIASELSDFDQLINPKTLRAHIESLYIPLEKPLAKISAKYYGEIANRLADLGDPDSFADLHRAEAPERDGNH